MMKETGFSLRFLGQNSFILMDVRGFSVAIDPYLSDWCATRGLSKDPTAKRRLFPPPIAPGWQNRRDLLQNGAGASNPVKKLLFTANPAYWPRQNRYGGEPVNGVFG